MKGRSGGRNARTTQAHVLLGTFRGDRHGAHETPEPPRGRPSPPGKLEGTASAEWNRMVERLEQTGALSIVDDAALYQYVQLYAETERVVADHKRIRALSAKLLRLAGKLIGTELLDAMKQIANLEGILAKHATQLRQGHMALRQYLVEFGMTPSARTRVKLPPGAGKPLPVDPLTALTARVRGA